MAGRYYWCIGAFVLTLCGYVVLWPWMFLDVGDDPSSLVVIWVCAVVFGVWRFRQDWQAEHFVTPGCLLLPAGCIAAGIYAMCNGWYLDDSVLSGHVSRALWLAFIAENVMCLCVIQRGLVRATRDGLRHHPICLCEPCNDHTLTRLGASDRRVLPYGRTGNAAPGAARSVKESAHERLAAAADRMALPARHKVSAALSSRWRNPPNDRVF
jgi:hypothetical protein